MDDNCYCCKLKCIVAPRRWKSENIPCNQCNARGFCHCKCINYPVVNCSQNVHGIMFCCNLECLSMDLNCDKVIPCKKCKALYACHCKCVTWMKHMIETHCCPLFCFELSNKELYEECEICKGDCLCRCFNYKMKLATKVNVSIVCINKTIKVCVKNTKLKKYCCDKKCYPVPETLICGIACVYCKEINYCRCNCETYNSFF